MDKDHVELYTNCYNATTLGPSGFSYTIRYWQDIKKKGLYLIEEPGSVRGFKFDGRMEILPTVIGLTSIIDKIANVEIKDAKQIDLITGSKYLYDTIIQDLADSWQRNGWVDSEGESIKNKDLWQSLLDFQDKFKKLNITLNIILTSGEYPY